MTALRYGNRVRYDRAMNWLAVAIQVLWLVAGVLGMAVGPTNSSQVAGLVVTIASAVTLYVLLRVARKPARRIE